MKIKNKKTGFAAMTAVLILGIVATVLLPSILLINTDNIRVEMAVSSSGKALNLANACAETALNKLRNNSSYTGNETITYSIGNCQILTFVGSSPNYTIRTRSTINNYTKKIQVITSQITPVIIVTSWQETDF